jgi:methylglutaconyl-CoA hydratase
MASIILDHRDCVLRLTLNRPDLRNAFDEEVIAGITAAATVAANDPSLRAVVLSGAGRVFCAGADLAWMTKAIAFTQRENMSDAEDLAMMLERIDTLPVPVVGRIQGAAMGGGVGLAAVCDIVIAADDAVFGLTEVKLGILPAVIAPYVIRKIGISAARELFLTGARFSAERARELGLVHEVVPAGELDEAVERRIAEIRSSAPRAIAIAKALIRDLAAANPTEVIGLTTSTIAAQRVSPEGQEGMHAFLEKRKPSWKP